MIDEVINFILNFGLTLSLAGLIFLLLLLILVQTNRLHYIIYLYLFWFPLETVILRYFPPEYYAVVKYVPELTVYIIAALFALRFLFTANREAIQRVLRLPVLRWLLVFVLLTALTFAVWQYHITVWLFGLRQLFRFLAMAVIIISARLPEQIEKRILWCGAIMVVLQALLGIAQYAANGALDGWLFFADTIRVGGGITVGGLQEFWAPGSRVFATLGRYDQLGSFLALGLVMLYPWRYAPRASWHTNLFWTVFVGVAVALILTQSRASWLMALAGIVTQIILVGDRMAKRVLLYFAAIASIYVCVSALYMASPLALVDRPRQTLPERVLEAISWRSWTESFDGYGRGFFLINTPRYVVGAYPLLGVGLGRFGSGVAAVLGNTAVYDTLHMPFGIQNVIGQIDNNWLSLWAETGTLGLIAFGFVWYALWRMAYDTANATDDEWWGAVGLGFAGLVIGMIVVGCFGPYFEFRTLMCYFWTIAGMVTMAWITHVPLPVVILSEAKNPLTPRILLLTNFKGSFAPTQDDKIRSG